MPPTDGASPSSDRSAPLGPPAESTTRRPAGRLLAMALVGGLAIVVVVALIVSGMHPAIIGMRAATPPAGVIWFGTSLDSTSDTLPGQGVPIRLGEQVAYIAHLQRASAGEAFELQVTIDGLNLSLPGGTLTEGDDILSGVLPATQVRQAGTLTARVIDHAGDSLASGAVTIAP